MGLTIILQLCIFIVELTKAIVCMKELCRFQFKDKAMRYFFISSIIALSIISAILIFFPDIKLIDSIFVLLTLIIVLGVFRGKKVRIGVIFLISYITISIIDVFINILITKLMNIVNPIIMKDYVGLLLLNSISLIILGLIVLIRNKKKYNNPFPMAKLHWSFYFFIIAALFCLGIMFSYLQILGNETNNKVSYLVILSMLVVSLGMVIIIIMITRVSYSRDKYKALSKMNQEYLNMQQQYFVLLSEKNKDTRRFRHDIKNHLLCMQSLFYEDRIEEVKKYLNDLAGGFQEIVPKINTGNNVVDAIINDTLTKNQELKIEVRGFLPSPMLINSMDLCTIFSNTLTNAVEAIKKFENTNKVISFDIKNLEDNICIKVSNPVTKKVAIEGSNVNTSKIDQDMHGFGLANIKKCVEKYHGTIELSSTDNEFTIELVIKNRG